MDAHSFPHTSSQSAFGSRVGCSSHSDLDLDLEKQAPFPPEKVPLHLQSPTQTDSIRSKRPSQLSPKRLITAFSGPSRVGRGPRRRLFSDLRRGVSPSHSRSGSAASPLSEAPVRLRQPAKPLQKGKSEVARAITGRPDKLIVSLRSLAGRGGGRAGGFRGGGRGGQGRRKRQAPAGGGTRDGERPTGGRRQFKLKDAQLPAPSNLLCSRRKLSGRSRSCSSLLRPPGSPPQARGRSRSRGPRAAAGPACRGGFCGRGVVVGTPSPTPASSSRRPPPAAFASPGPLGPLVCEGGGAGLEGEAAAAARSFAAVLPGVSRGQPAGGRGCGGAAAVKVGRARARAG